jgi:SAM-dependent methyltransferase
MILQKILRRIVPRENIYAQVLRNKRGLEIGGPSRVFQADNLVPIYGVLEGLDGCNFSNQTIWEGQIVAGPSQYKFHDGKSAGVQYVSEAADLNGIPGGHYDLVASSHCLEHVANPIKALERWLAVTRETGHILLIVPHKEGTFDHKRSVTTLQHLLNDYANNTQETDLSHLDEILALHDLDMDPPAGTIEQFRARSLDNFHNRCLHHHVFDSKLVIDLFDHLNVQLIDIQAKLPYHIIAFGQKVSGKASNARFYKSIKKASFFASDK